MLNIQLIYGHNINTGQVLNGPNNPIHVSAGAGKVVAGSDNSVYVACWSADRVDKVVADARQASWPVGVGPEALLLIER